MGTLPCGERAGRTVHTGRVRADDAIGYGSLLLRSKHVRFAEADVLEVSDLVVAEGARWRGVATALLTALEAVARDGGAGRIGLGVGLYAHYGPAQIMYVRTGYRPDGSGVSSGGRIVSAGDTVRVDDDLVLWLTKSLDGGVDAA